MDKDFLSIINTENTGSDYSYEVITAEISTAEAARHRDVARFEKLCRECPCYGRRWCCPPLETDELEKPEKYPTLTLVGARITPKITGRPIEEAGSLIADCRRHIEPQILKKEKETGGFAALFTGQCTHCGKQKCTRIKGDPCRHPELVRPS
ncbi:MAG: DUF2284 domain-containing protein, partial [Muribaculaceae bacterium]|nr:DUF2284 domain-containing protein [Muribaculaceae bacterium]